MKEFIWKCPKCNKDIVYLTKMGLKYATENNVNCKQCKQEAIKNRRWYGKCFECGKELIYFTSSGLAYANKHKSTCKVCKSKAAVIRESERSKIKWSKNCPKCQEEQVYKDKYSLQLASKENRVCKKCAFDGEENPFYGKTHSKESREEIAKANKGKKYSGEINKKKASVGTDNGMYDKSFYDSWIVKYGKEEADKKLSQYKDKVSKRCSGSGNPMYGQPAPKGSGGGISGWYKGWYFRSLRELTYVIKVIEPSGRAWKTGENKDFIIKYKDEKGSDRTYRVDFIIDDVELVEIKPDELRGSDINKIKAQAAEEFCKSKGYSYRIVDINPICKKELIQMVIDKKVELLKKWKERLLK